MSRLQGRREERDDVAVIHIHRGYILSSPEDCSVN